MESVKTKLEYSITVSGNDTVPVIVVAAGNSSRMGGINKQTMELDGIPVIARTLGVFNKSEFVSKIILVTKSDDIFKMQSICHEYGFDKVTDIISGGKDRHESVLCGIGRLSKEDKTVLIHDGARPFVTDVMVSDCITALKTDVGCLCALKVTDTVKQANQNGCVEKTVDRSNLYYAQTPQGVHVKEYLKASEEYKNTVFTDDASVLEAAGYSVKIVSGDKRNIKITTVDDIKIAESIIGGEEE